MQTMHKTSNALIKSKTKAKPQTVAIIYSAFCSNHINVNNGWFDRRIK